MFATLNGNRIRTLTVTMPFLGPWTADVILDQSVSISGNAVTITLGNLTLKGTITRSGDFVGTGSFRVVGGAGAWGVRIDRKFYNSAFGVKLSGLLTDAARSVGETVKVDEDRVIAQQYTRVRGPASDLLRLLVDSWWIGPDGVTHVGTRPTPTVASHFDVLPQGTQLYIGKIQIATDSPEDWFPGVQFTAPTLTLKKANAVIHRLDSEKLRTEVWTA